VSTSPHDRSMFKTRTFRTIINQRSIGVSGTALWGSIPPELQDASSLSFFKQNLSDYLISQYG